MHLTKSLYAGTILMSVAGSTAAAPRAETAVLAGGCFWGMESVFEHVKGVTDVVSGYAGGSPKDANYEAADSGHAEAVRITYDPAKISYVQLLQIYFAVAHDPTEVNRQGPDVGASYRSAIFPQNASQETQAKSFIGKLEAKHVFRRPIATRIEHGAFFPAEAYHQDYARKHPWQPYIVINDRPKVTALKRQYPSLFKA
ncbi:MAG TPA: peptide-methionine (S)-S-oxide reductase MsrA [Sphingomicrobium sp.]